MINVILTGHITSQSCIIKSHMWVLWVTKYEWQSIMSTSEIFTNHLVLIKITSLPGEVNWPTSESITIHKNHGKGCNFQHQALVLDWGMNSCYFWTKEIHCWCPKCDAKHRYLSQLAKMVGEEEAVICNILLKVEFTRKVIWWE